MRRAAQGRRRAGAGRTQGGAGQAQGGRQLPQPLINAEKGPLCEGASCLMKTFSVRSELHFGDRHRVR